MSSTDIEVAFFLLNISQRLPLRIEVAKTIQELEKYNLICVFSFLFFAGDRSNTIMVFGVSIKNVIIF